MNNYDKGYYGCQYFTNDESLAQTITKGSLIDYNEANANERLRNSRYQSFASNKIQQIL